MKSLYLLFLFFLWYPAFAQKENNNWTFGTKAGINFNTIPPTLLATEINSVEGNASISDVSGNLLFYTNGLNVWDNTHTVMPNGTSLLGGLSATQGVSIVPVADDPNLYFVFTIQPHESFGKAYLSYSLVDMSLNAGKGDIVPAVKNVVLDSMMAEKMMIAPGCGSVWLVVHHRDSAIFHAYKISTSTSIPPPVISRTAGYESKAYYTIGEMKLSADFRTVVMGCYTVASVVPKQQVELFDFDLETGSISGYMAIDEAERAYSVELSPDKSKLYVADFAAGGYQYDLSLLPDVSAVRASKFKLAGSGGYYCFRRGPDGKIYIRHGAPQDVSCIHDPDKAGLACNLELNVPALKNASTGYINLGLDAFRPLQPGSILKTSRQDTLVCPGVKVVYPADPSHTGFEWNDGSTDKDRPLTLAGTYWRQSSSNCFLYVDTFVVAHKPTDTTYGLALDTVVCFKEQVDIPAVKEYSAYLWSDGTETRSNRFTGSAVKWVAATNYDCKMQIDTYRVSMISFELVIPDTVICPAELIPLTVTIPGATAYQWQDNSAAATFTADKAGQYWVKVWVGACSKTDTVNIAEKPYSVDLGADHRICEGDSVQLGTDLKGSYLWLDGSTTASVWVRQSGIYGIQVTDAGCRAEDSVRVDVVRCSNCVAVPNAFTPNKDGINDGFKALTFCATAEYEMIVVNRYGQQVFNSKLADEAWDGSFNGQACELGVYYYLIKVRFDYPGAAHEIYKGDVHLVR